MAVAVDIGELRREVPPDAPLGPVSRDSERNGPSSGRAFVASGEVFTVNAPCPSFSRKCGRTKGNPPPLST